MYDEGLCRFIDAHKDATELDCDLNVLADKYKLNPNSTTFASIYSKIYGMVQFMGWSFQQVVPPEEICSTSFICLQKSLDSWNSDKHKNIKFLSYFTKILRNDLITRSRSKHYRDCHKYNSSLDTMFEDGFDTFNNQEISIEQCFNVNSSIPEVNILLENITKYNIYLPKHIKEALDMDKDTLNKCKSELKKLLKKDTYFSNILKGTRKN